MNVIGIDLETTGVDPLRDKIWELGFAVLNTRTNTILDSYSSFVSYGEGLTIPEEIQNLCRINPEHVLRYGKSLGSALVDLDIACKKFNVGAFVAHNCIFEINFLAEALREEKSVKLDAKHVPWIDTMLDIEYPAHVMGKSLENVCAQHRVMNLNPHRALFDVHAMLEVLKCYPFMKVKENFHRFMTSKQFVVQALVDYDRREEAKKEKFYWQDCGGETFPKKWVKTMTEDDITSVVPRYNFGIKKLKEISPRRYL